VESTSGGTTTSVYDMQSVKIISTPSDTTFKVEGYFTDEFVSGGIAKRYKFTVSAPASERGTDSLPAGGHITCRQFEVTSSQNTTVTSVSGNFSRFL